MGALIRQAIDVAYPAAPSDLQRAGQINVEPRHNSRSSSTPVAIETETKDAYLAALRSVRAQTLNLETWMRYFLDGLATEYERVEREIGRLRNVSRSRGDGPLQLSEAQQRGIAELVLRGVSEFNRRDYEHAAGVGRNLATRDLRALAEAGVVKRLGEGSTRRYRFAESAAGRSWADRGGGRPREWTDERIERELRALVGSATVFPSVDRFDAAGRRDLYNEHREG